MSCLLEYRKIKTKNIKKLEDNSKFIHQYKMLSVDNCNKIKCIKAYSFDSRISYHYHINQK